MNENQNQLEDKMIALLATIRRVPDSAAGKKALNEFLTLCLQLPGLRRDSHPDYQEALYQTLFWISKNIQNFDVNKSTNPTESFLVNLTRWINGMRLNHLIRDLYRGKSDGYPLPDEIPDDGNYESKEEIEKIYEEICRKIEEDANLRKIHLRQRPEFNCQLLVKKLFFQEPPEKIPTIARKFDIPEQTIYAFWRQRCKPALENLLQSDLDNLLSSKNN